MRTIFNIIILILIWSFSGSLTPCGAAQETTLDSVTLESAFRELLIADSPFHAGDLEISGFTCSPDSHSVPSGYIEYIPDMGRMSGKLGRRTVFVTILVEGKNAGKVKMTGDLNLFGDVVVAAGNLKRGAVLTDDDLLLSRKNISMLGPKVITNADMVIGKQLKTSLRPGAILFSSLVKIPQVIKRGDRVIITAASSSIHITVPGQAKSAGAVGELIKVKNMMSRKEIYARIINEDEVVVDL